MNRQQYRTITSRKRLLTGLALLASLTVFLISDMAGTSEAQTRGPQRKSAAAKETPRYKAIWEPVNYSEDMRLTDVFFVNDQVGWVSGGANAGGVILHTRNGGDNWTIQLGDPKSQEPGIHTLRFLNEKHGWAAQGDQLLHTADGQNWEQIGSFNYQWHDYAFTSETTGVYLRKNQIFQTRDAGRTWKDVFTCDLKIEVEGLMREAPCTTMSVHFPSPNVGYVLGLANGARAILKTADGGANWGVWSMPSLSGDSGYEGEIFFNTEQTGFIRTAGGKMFKTPDGGKTWTGVVASAGPEIKFANTTVGWSFWDTWNRAFGSALFSYTTDGGNRWVSHKFAFPANVRGFSLPQPDRGYVVGDHGMVYRYRVVPFDYTARGMIDAPMMGGGEPAAR